ncbi:hypothetical protein MTO96_012225 [Rhipicephalus appendiculatus]
MEFAFDDDVFDSPRIRCSEPGTSYDAKICESEWFLTATADNTEEMMMLEKYKGDYHYARNEFDSALAVYERCFNLAPNSAISVMRDCAEGMSKVLLEPRPLRESVEVRRNAGEAVNEQRSQGRTLDAALGTQSDPCDLTLKTGGLPTEDKNAVPGGHCQGISPLQKHVTSRCFPRLKIWLQA